MAVTYQSTQIQTLNYSGNPDITVSKPASTAEGDLLMLHITNNSTVSGTDIASWTLVNEVLNGCTSHVYYKIATASEPSSYTFTVSGAGGNARAAISRFTGHDLDSASPINASNVTSDTASSTTLTQSGITPTVANCMLLFFAANANDRNHSGYAIATSNPTWTERYDSSDALNRPIAMATATRPETTATGNGTATVSGAATTTKMGHLVAIQPGQTVTISAGLVTATGSIGSPDYYVDTVSADGSVFDPDFSPIWADTSKNGSTWEDINKT